ncbi:MAG: carbohydrate ABC transporter permease [Blastochloris sp.]|nr:carbohydrate ABC transporter permease [Blastochloris sp.]
MAEFNPVRSHNRVHAAEPAQQTTTRRRPAHWGRLASYVILTITAVIAALPFLWMFNWSFMSSFEYGAGYFTPSRLLPGNIAAQVEQANAAGQSDFNVLTDYVFANYIDSWERARLAEYMWNSVQVTAIQVTGVLVICIPAAYAFARIRFFGRGFLFTVMLTTLMIPGVVTLIPNYLTVVWLSRFSESVFGPGGAWLDSWPSLTIPFMASAFTIFLLRQFFAQIPEDLWDAAQLDGATHLAYLLRVVIPLARAPILTVAIFTFIGAWNALVWPLLVITTDEWRYYRTGVAVSGANRQLRRGQRANGSGCDHFAPRGDHLLLRAEAVQRGAVHGQPKMTNPLRLAVLSACFCARREGVAGMHIAQLG